MFGLMLICRIWRNKEIPVWKLAVTAPVLTVCGTFGAYLLYFIENMKWGGISFYGSLFVIPVLFIPFSFLIKEKYGELLDYCAPSVCIMLAINKINCIRTGCCKGMVLHTLDDGSVTRFPSQVVELLTALAIAALLMFFIKKCRFSSIIYPVFLLIYGVLRFGLNLLRETTPFALGLPAGNFWSIIAILIGGAWLGIYIVCTKRKSGAVIDDRKKQKDRC